VTATVASQIGHLALRTIARTVRQPANLAAPLIFPLAVMTVNAAGLEPAERLPGFPADSFLAFMLAAPFIHGALFATANAGTDLARDIQTGFLNRISLTPMRGSALLVGQLLGMVVIGLGQALVYLAVGLAAGVEIEAGFLGVLVLLALAALVALGFAALGATAALRTGSTEAVQGLFPVFFVFLFMSSLNMPRDLMEVDWFRIVATLNPVSYLIEGIRSLIIAGWEPETLALSFGVGVALASAGIVAAAFALRERLART
jgi:ABC-2 type transport system permease protein